MKNLKTIWKGKSYLEEMLVKLPTKQGRIMTYDYEAYPLAIMEANGDRHYEWMMSNYIQLNSHDDILKNKEVFLAFYADVGLNSPFLNVQHMFWSLLTKYDMDMIKFLKENIDWGYYLYLKIDEFYIENRWAYNICHYVHDNLVIGYDNNNFIILGYDKNGRFTETGIPAEMLYKSIYSDDYSRDEGSWADDIYFIKYKKGEYTFNRQLVKLSLNDYLNSINTIENYKRFSNSYEDTVYGLKVYDKVIEYLNYIKTTDIIFRGDKIIDNRIFRIIMEHKSLMNERIIYLEQSNDGIGEIVEKYKKVYSLSRNVHSMAIKYKITEKKSILDSLMDSVKKIQEMDYELLSKLVEQI